MKRKIYLAISFFIVITVIIALFFFSGQDGSSSSRLSESIVRFILRVSGFDANAYRFAKINYAVRKLAHFSIYTLFGIGMFGLARYYLHKCRFTFAVAVSLAVAAADEFHQTFVSGRNGAIRDVIIDLSGAVFGYICCAVAVIIVHAVMKRNCKR